MSNASPTTNDAAHPQQRLRRHDPATVLRSIWWMGVVLLLTSRDEVAAFSITPQRVAPRASAPNHHRGLFSSRDVRFTADSTMESFNNNNNDSTMMTPTFLYGEIQQPPTWKQTPTFQWNQQLSAVAATWFFAPMIIVLLAVPSISASAATAASTSVVQEAVDNLAYAILPESTPDLVSVVLGEGMGYATYFLFTAAAITSIFSFNHNHQQQQQDEANMVMERDGEVSLFAAGEMEDHHALFSPVDGGLEEDALVPCAFNVVEQTLPMAPEGKDNIAQHQSLLHHLDWVEIFFDVTKWLSYFVLQSDLGGTLSLDGGVHTVPHLVESAMFGFLAGFGAKFYADVLYRHFEQGPELKRAEMTRSDWPTLCLLEATSAASLFTVYEAVQSPAQEWIQWMTNECVAHVLQHHPVGLW